MTAQGAFAVLIAIVAVTVLVSFLRWLGQRGVATVAGGLRALEADGGMEGKTEQDFVKAMGGNPQSIHEMAGGQRLLQWASGTTDLQRIAVLFDREYRFVRVTSRFQV